MHYTIDTRERRIYSRALDLFNNAYMRGQIKHFIAKLRKRSRHLHFLNEMMLEDRSEMQLPTKPIRMEQIIGTVGRLDRFDKDFLPLQRRLRTRWVGIAQATLDNDVYLPPIQVVQAQDAYYVIDGHHRVSVARALDKLYIDANVTIWR